MRGKLVRDRIPEIIREAGDAPVVKTVSGAERATYVREKLEEELREYLDSGDVTELADIVEACFAAASLHGVDREQLLAMTECKRHERGGFEKWIVWSGNV